MDTEIPVGVPAQGHEGVTVSDRISEAGLRREDRADVPRVCSHRVDLCVALRPCVRTIGDAAAAAGAKVT
jgi:hypothetical protein